MIRINNELINEVSSQARQSPRLRKNLNFHKEASATMQRMLNAMEPNTYIQPHKHENPDKTEVFFSLRGRLAVVTFMDDGAIADAVVLNPETGSFGVEVPPRTWHMIVSLDEGAVSYEVKDGPYDVAVDKCFAVWAPAEGDVRCGEYLETIKKNIERLLG